MKKVVLLVVFFTGINSSFCKYEKYIKTYCTQNNLIISGCSVIALFSLYKGITDFIEIHDISNIIKFRKMRLTTTHFEPIDSSLPFKEKKFKNYISGTCWLCLATISSIGTWYLAKNKNLKLIKKFNFLQRLPQLYKR